MAVSNYSTNPDENTTISGINIAEGCAPSGINNAIRQLMADVKEAYDAQAEANENLEKAAETVMTGATSEAAGKSGNVPGPQAGDNNKALFGDGTYKDVVRSVGGALPDSNGNVEAPYLPLAGGGITGSISFYRDKDYIGSILSADDDTSGKSLLVDTWEDNVDDGAFLRLHKGSDNDRPGYFYLAARNTNSSAYADLVGTPDNRLLWRGRRLVETVNGITPDNNGDIRAFVDVWIGEASGGFTMPWDGFVIGRFAGGSGQEFRIYRNGGEIFYARQADQGYGTLQFPFCVAAYAGEWVSASDNAWYGVRAVRK